MKNPNETYLGDGLYASFDGYQICLRAPREHEDHVVFLETAVWYALMEFVEQHVNDRPVPAPEPQP